MSCSHVFSRGPKKGSLCGTKLTRISKARGLCGVHCDATREKERVTVAQKALEASTRMYRVEIDNSSGVYKKSSPEETVVRVVREARALRLQKLGAKIEPLENK